MGGSKAVGAPLGAMGSASSCYAFANAACGGCSSGCFCDAYWNPAPNPFPEWDATVSPAGWKAGTSPGANAPQCQCGLPLSMLGGFVVAGIGLLISIIFCILFCCQEEKKTHRAKILFIVLIIFMNIFTSALVMGIFMAVSAGGVK